MGNGGFVSLVGWVGMSGRGAFCWIGLGWLVTVGFGVCVGLI